jgi:hypothetical protein
MTKRDCAVLVSRVASLLLFFWAAELFLEAPFYSSVIYLWKADWADSVLTGGWSDYQAVLSIGEFVLAFILITGLALFLFRFGPNVSRFFEIEKGQ